MKKLMIVFALLSFSNLFLSMDQFNVTEVSVSSFTSEENIYEPFILEENIDEILKEHGYTKEEISLWKKLHVISKKEELGLPLTWSEQVLAELDDYQLAKFDDYQEV